MDTNTLTYSFLYILDLSSRSVYIKPWNRIFVLSVLVSAISNITCAILVTLWTKTEASNAACGLPKAPIPIWPAGVRGPANWDELWKWRSTCKNIYNITLRKMPHLSSRKESTLLRQVPPKSIDFLLDSCDPLFPYTNGNAQRGLWVICRKLNFYFRANSLFYGSTNIWPKKQGLIRLTILFLFVVRRRVSLWQDSQIFWLLSLVITRLRREMSQKSSLKKVPQCNSKNTGPVPSVASKWPKFPGNAQEQQSWKNPKLSKPARGQTLSLH